MAIGTGTITAMSRDGKRFQIDDGEWYSVFSSAQMNGAMRGSNVNFSYVTTPPKGPEGRAYNNVKGNLTINAGAAPAPTTGASKPAATGGTGGFRGGRSFPVGPLDPERSIIRQNSLAHAVKMAEQIPGGRPDDWEDYVDWVIAMARRVEAYSSGDLDAEIADAAVAEISLKGY